MEYRALQALNDDLLDHNDRLPPRPDRLQAKAADPAFRDRALRLIQQMDKETREHQAVAWIWKDARLPLVLPFWADIWGEVIYVVTVRHPAETTLSVVKGQEFTFENFPFSAGFIYWQYCMPMSFPLCRAVDAKFL